MSDGITIEFTVMSDFTRRPIGRTCGMFVELPECYENFPDFRAEFNEILDSNVTGDGHCVTQYVALQP